VIDVAMCEKAVDGDAVPGDTTRQIENPQPEPEDLAGVNGDETEPPEELPEDEMPE
jgi:hypothetical protein